MNIEKTSGLLLAKSEDFRYDKSVSNTNLTRRKNNMKKQVMSACLLAVTIATINGCGNKASTVTNTVEPTEQAEATVEATQSVEETEEPQEDISTQETASASQGNNDKNNTDANNTVSESTKQPTTTQEASQNDKSDSSHTKTEKKTLEGEFLGFADGNSVEISLEDGVRVFRIGNDASKDALNKLEEGARFIFEVEVAKDIDTIVKVFE